VFNRALQKSENCLSTGFERGIRRISCNSRMTHIESRGETYVLSDVAVVGKRVKDNILESASVCKPLIFNLSGFAIPAQGSKVLDNSSKKLSGQCSRRQFVDCVPERGECGSSINRAPLLI